MPRKINNDDIKIKLAKSSLVEFTKRPLASEKDLENFEKYANNEIREEGIEESLEEIYQDDDGNMVNVKTLDKKKRPGVIYWLLIFLFIGGILAAAGYYAYNYYLIYSVKNSTVSLNIDADKETVIAKEFFYTVNYKNEENVDINNIVINLTFPDNFIFMASQPKASESNHIWRIPFLGAHRSDQIKIKGKLIGSAGSSNIILADMIYTPANFSSEFKKSASQEMIIADSGLNLSAVTASTALIGDINEITVKYDAKEESYLDNFRLTIDPPNNWQFIATGTTNSFITAASSSDQNTITRESTAIYSQANGQSIWDASDINNLEKTLKIRFKINNKQANSQDLDLKFFYPLKTDQGIQYYQFDEKKLSLTVIKSDLSLNLIINGSPADQGVDFGQTLNYSLAYSNKGETDMKDVLIMVVLESDYLDWKTLADKNGGVTGVNSLSWSKNEIPLLADFPKNSEGTIDFLIKLRPADNITPTASYQVKSYAQYSIEGRELNKDEKTQSNVIINKINSDLKASLQIKYFNSDNLAVGSGPLPPKVGQTTSYKVYLALNNNLHELNNLKVVLDLPVYVSWDGKNSVSAGTIDFNSQNHQVTWRIGQLPISVYQADAEFNISITPQLTDKNTIMILLPKTVVSAVDSETKMDINKILPVKTTKLEDDSIANSDGVVE